jgi:predicted transcriptional regulator
MVRLDRAGQFSKSFMGASTARFAGEDVSCPLWDAHRAFERGGELVVQYVSLEDSSEVQGGWLTMMRSVEGSGAGGSARFVIAVGIEAVLASELAQARRLSLRSADAQPIGPGCARCHRESCPQRSLPPRGRKLHFDRMRRGTTPFEFGET